MQHPVIWFEVMGADAPALQSFYSSLFNWEFKALPDSNGYAMVNGERGGIPGGVGQAHEGPGWGATFYVGVTDIDAKFAECVAAGARVILPVTTVPETRVAVLADPEGHVFGLAQPLA